MIKQNCKWNAEAKSSDCLPEMALDFSPMPGEKFCLDPVVVVHPSISGNATKTTR